MAGSDGYTFTVRRTPTAMTTAVTMGQIKAGAAALDIIGIWVYQVTKTSSELLSLQLLRKTAAATVTSFTPLKLDPGSAAALAVGGTAATGITATAEGTDGDILHEEVWNVLNGVWQYLPVPRGVARVPQAGIIALKLSTAPAASMSVGFHIDFVEYQ